MLVRNACAPACPDPSNTQHVHSCQRLAARAVANSLLIGTLVQLVQLGWQNFFLAAV